MRKTNMIFVLICSVCLLITKNVYSLILFILSLINLAVSRKV